MADPVDTILTVCGSCGSMLGHYYAELLPDHPHIQQFTRAITDISAYLADRNTPDLHRHSVDYRPLRVTYHESCHLNRAQGVSRQVRDLVARSAAVELVEMRNADSCCGFGGSFNLAFPQVSHGIQAAKIDAIAATGASIVITGCPGCKLHIFDGIMRRGLNVEVLHTIELLARVWKEPSETG